MPQIGLFCAVAGSLCAWVGLCAALAWPKAAKAIRLFQVVTAVFCGLSFALLMVLVARADPHVGYAVKHAAPADAGLGYRLAAVWAGQAGGLLLWAFETALIALFIRPAVMPRAAGVLLAIEGCLLGMVALRNPFGPPEPGASGGMNPMLLHPMMLVHPPMLFLGYALLAVPYAVTVGALVDGQPEAWPRQVWPWMLVAWLALTLGNGFGAEWAYKTFGWGGFWAWDPVENTSFVPWMLAATAVHGLWLAQRRGRWLRASAVAAMASFLAVLYGSYLARSGALAGASVHAYAAGERLMQFALLTLLVGAGAVAAFCLTTRWTAWQVAARAGDRQAHESAASDVKAAQGPRPHFDAIGPRVAACCITAMTVIAVFVLVGMSLPMAGLSPTATLYNTVLMPVALVMLVLMAALLEPRLTSGGGGLLVAFGVLVAAAGAAMALRYGATIERGWLMAAQATFAPALLLVSAIVMLWSLWGFWTCRRPLRERGSAIAHFGVAALLAGAVLSGYGTASQKAYLATGAEQTVLGHFISVMSISQPSPGLTRAEIYADGHTGTVEIERNQLFDVELRRAYIRRGLFSDLYITPHAILTQPAQVSGQKVPPGAMVEVAVKPGMSLVWIGMLAIAGGIGIALWRRLRWPEASQGA